jgi:hypothetical protein
MPMVKFPWDALLISIRRDVCPRARWQKTSRGWVMTDLEAETFLQAAQALMYSARVTCNVTVGSTVWVLGFAMGTPYRRNAEPDRSAAASVISTERAGLVDPR